MSRFAILLFMVSCALNIHAQEERKNNSSHTKEIVKYVRYLSNGKIDQVIRYKPTRSVVWDKTYSTKEEAFFYGIGLPSTQWVNMGAKIGSQEISDEAFGHSAIVGARFQYIYNEMGSLNHIVRNGYLDSAIYFYGSHSQVSSIASEYNVDGKVGDLIRMEFEVYNHSDSTINLSQYMRTLSFSDRSAMFVLKPRSMNKLVLSINPISGFVKDTLTLFSKGFSINYPVKCFGYALCTKDILEGKPLTIAPNFYYKRIGSEALLTVYDKDQETVIFRMPLTTEKMEINLNELGKGDFVFSLHDFRRNKKTPCNVRIE